MYRHPRGALLTVGEHKGYALAFVCKMLAGALCGSDTMRPERQGRGTATNGMLTIIIDPRPDRPRVAARGDRGDDRLHHRIAAGAALEPVLVEHDIHLYLPPEHSWALLDASLIVPKH